LSKATSHSGEGEADSGAGKVASKATVSNRGWASMVSTPLFYSKSRVAMRCIFFFFSV